MKIPWTRSRIGSNSSVIVIGGALAVYVCARVCPCPNAECSQTNVSLT